MKGTNGGVAAGGFRFRVSDVFRVPLRGTMLRLRLVEGRPDGKQLRRGRVVLLRAPDGAERAVEIRGIAATAGRATAERLERTGEIDLVISDADAGVDGRPVEIGWTVVV